MMSQEERHQSGLSPPISSSSFYSSSDDDEDDELSWKRNPCHSPPQSGQGRTKKKIKRSAFQTVNQHWLHLPTQWFHRDDEDDDEKEEEQEEVLATTSPAPPPPPSDTSCLTPLHDHDCIVYILDFLSWSDLNNFAQVSQECCDFRNHASLEQTRSGTIKIDGTGCKNAIDLLNVIKERQYSSKVFKGNRTHLRLEGLNNLGSYIEPINEVYIRTEVESLHGVKTLDCSLCPDKNNHRRRPWLSPYRDYIDKGFAHGLAISLLTPNLKEIDMSYLPLTLLGVDWLLQSNSNLEVIKWNKSVIWPITNDTSDNLKACKNLKEIYVEDARMLFCDPQNWNLEEMWQSLTDNCKRLERVSVKGAKYHYKLSTLLQPIPQDCLMKFVRCTGPNLKWFCSNLSKENIKILQKERPDVIFC